MSKVLFVDQNQELVEKVINANICEAWHGDVFDAVGVIVSASNPQFTMGAGLDAQIAYRYPKTCALIDRSKGNQRINNVIFTVTVDETLQATPELVREAIRFALSQVDESETLLLTGLGTGIGEMSEEVFVELLKEELKNQN